MNNPPEPPRMSSLDRRIEAARRRGERERAAAHPQPTQGLTSTMSTESCDIAQPRNQVPTFLVDWPAGCTTRMWAEIAAYGVQCSTTKELAPTGALVQAMKEIERMEQCLLAAPSTSIPWHDNRLRGASSAADPVHTIIQHEAGHHPWAQFLPGKQASQQAQPVQIAGNDNRVRGIGDGIDGFLDRNGSGAKFDPWAHLLPHETMIGSIGLTTAAAAQLAGNEYQQGTGNVCIGKGCDRNGVPTK